MMSYVLAALVTSGALALCAAPTRGEERPTGGAGGAPGAAALKLPAAWEISAPLVAPVERPENPCISVKDPTVVFADGNWHVFATIRGTVKSHGIEYLSFDKWENANAAKRHVLNLRDGYYCAPQVLYFRPHKKWYLIYQTGEPTRKLKHQVAFSTTDKVGDPDSWTKTDLLFESDERDGRKEAGLDYWVICDDKRAYLFFTACNGKMWRMWTDLKDFPHGFRDCQLALQGDIFEASHTYRLKGLDKYLTLIEANPGGKRYYKAYLADRLDGDWKPATGAPDALFASSQNVKPATGVALWSDNISHGELLRDTVDETLTVDPANLRFLFQGVLEKDKAGKKYGDIPWRLGLLKPLE